MKATLSGEISGYAAVDASVVEIDGDLEVRNGATLHLPSGVCVKVLPGVALKIEGGHPGGMLVMGNDWRSRLRVAMRRLRIAAARMATRRARGVAL